MKFELTTRNAESVKTPALVLFLFENERPALPPAASRLLGKAGRQEFQGKLKQVLLLHTGAQAKAERILLVGLGKQADCTSEAVRRATGQVIRSLRSASVKTATVQLRKPDQLEAFVDAAILTGYQFTRFRDPAKLSPSPTKLTIALPPNTKLQNARAVLGQAQTIAEAANYAREIANLPGNVVYPAVLADYARQLAREAKLKCTVFNQSQLQRGRFGGLLAVGGGSARDPRLVCLEYKPARARNRQPIALVGKAMTFDSGGLSIKAADRMDEMKFDKCGGCAVLGAMRAIAKLKLPLHVIGVVASAENMPSDRSYRPGDIVTSYRGKDRRAVTIEVLNTDAEGRVILGDALVYAREKGAGTLIDLATLTGACVVALGDVAAGLLGNDEQLQTRLRAAAERTGERVWPLPLWDEFRDKIKSAVADHQNTGGRYGGAITAAAFLERYVANVPWAHLDIAGTAWNTKELPYFEKGATGFGVRLLVDLLRHWD